MKFSSCPDENTNDPKTAVVTLNYKDGTTEARIKGEGCGLTMTEARTALARASYRLIPVREPNCIIVAGVYPNLADEMIDQLGRDGYSVQKTMLGLPHLV